MAFSRLFTLLGSKPKTRTGNKFPKAKAKDLASEAKAKDTIGWPRGASRPRPCPRGLQLWVMLLHFYSVLVIVTKISLSIAILFYASLVYDDDDEDDAGLSSGAGT